MTTPFGACHLPWIRGSDFELAAPAALEPSRGVWALPVSAKSRRATRLIEARTSLPFRDIAIPPNQPARGYHCDASRSISADAPHRRAPACWCMIDARPRSRSPSVLGEERMFCRSLARSMTIVLGLAASTAAGTDAPDPSKFVATDLFDLEYVADPQISPDGSQIVYVRRSMDIMKDNTRSNLWIVDDAGNHRPLLSDAENFSSPRWSPRGDRLAYVASVEGEQQLFVRWMDTGQTALVTNLRESPASVTWSPDGKTLAFTMLVKADRKP